MRLLCEPVRLVASCSRARGGVASSSLARDIRSFLTWIIGSGLQVSVHGDSLFSYLNQMSFSHPTSMMLKELPAARWGLNGTRSKPLWGIRVWDRLCEFVAYGLIPNSEILIEFHSPPFTWRLTDFTDMTATVDYTRTTKYEPTLIACKKPYTNLKAGPS